MKKQQGRGGGKRGGSHRDDDHEIWQYAAATIEPLKRTKAKGRFHPASDAVKSITSKPKATTPEQPVAKPQAAPPPPSHVSPAKPGRATTPELALFDRNSVRKIRGGRLEIEARVDLHGMRQHEAHVALKRFLLSCQSRGLRYVLIITGKGKANGSAATHIGEADRERGVLKRNVPRWLDEPDMRAIVVSFTTAAVQHGGDGAIYVHLRSKNRA